MIDLSFVAFRFAEFSDFISFLTVTSNSYSKKIFSSDK